MSSKPTRKRNGDIVFKDHPEFVPNLSPKEIFHLGSFGGTYYRPIKSQVTNKKYQNVWQEFPKDWFPLPIEKYVTSNDCDKSINKYKATSGTSLRYWESKGWIESQDPYGWVQWYMRFYMGKRSDDDERQISRFNKIAGPKGRWRSNLVNRINKANSTVNDYTISPKIRQLLQQWAFVVKKPHLKI